MSLLPQSYGAESPPGSPADSATIPDHDIQLLLPESVTRSLGKRLFFDIRDALFPEKLPPLQLTSRPVETGMLLGDIVSLPWYRTVFTNIGNVISPETLPPLELETRPVDVGELISDQMSHQWWTSLLRNLVDQIAPERLPPLNLTARPFDTGVQSGPVQVVPWSSTINLPRVPLSARQFVTNEPLKPRVQRAPLAPQLAEVSVAQPVLPIDAASANVHAHRAKLKGKLSRSRLREGILIAIAVLEALYLLASFFGLA
jgi:hypothetical protein